MVLGGEINKQLSYVGNLHSQNALEFAILHLVTESGVHPSFGNLTEGGWY